jgi:hypothetical protein
MQVQTEMGSREQAALPTDGSSSKWVWQVEWKKGRQTQLQINNRSLTKERRQIEQKTKR